MITTFVGRRAELAQLARVCSKSIAEELPAAALVSGPPGSGKSRLLSEVGGRQPSVRKLRVAGFEAGAQVPLAASADLLRDLGKVPAAGELVTELLFAPKLGTHRPLEPLRVLEAARQALLGIDDPVVLLVDDVQWIDELSMALCSYLVRAAATELKKVAVIAASRPSTSAMIFRDSLIAELGTDRVEFLELGPLDQDDAVQLVRQLAPDRSAEQVADIRARAKGSPFWLGMLARAGEKAEIADYLAARQQGLGSDSAGLLGLLAITTRPLATTECAGLLAWQQPRCERAVAELERSGLVTRLGQSLAIAHDLIRASVMTEMPAVRRRELHAALATWLEKEAETDVRLLQESLIHRREAGMDLADLALRVLGSPRRRLLGRAGLAELAQVADSVELGEPVAAALRLSVAQLAGELGEQQIALDHWSALAAEVSDPALRATAYLAASRAAMLIVDRKQEALALLERAQELPIDDAVLAVEIESHQANLLQVVKRQAEDGRRAAFGAAERARALWGQPPVELLERERDAYLAALQVAFDAAVVEEDGTTQLRLADELTHVARGSEEGSVWAAQDRATALMFAGRSAEAIESAQRAWTRARERMLPMLVLTSGSCLVGKLLEAGRLAEADEVISECLELERRVTGSSERFAMGRVGDFSIHALRHELWLSRGDWGDAVSSLDGEIARQGDPHSRMHLHWHVFVWLARCADRSRTQQIDQHLAACREDARAAGCRRCSRELALRTAETFARLGRLRDAESQLVMWDESGRHASARDGLWRRQVGALVALANGDSSGVAELVSVLDATTKLGLVHSALWTRLDLGAAVQATDSRRAAEEFRLAGELAGQLGSTTEQQMAELALRRLGVRTWRRSRAPRGERALDMLSEREKQIAALIAAGHSNPEIAGRLFLSRKTIERHISNILARTGTRNRTELARLLSAQEVSSATT